VEAPQGPLSWGLPILAVLDSCHFHSGFVAQHSFCCPEQGQRTPGEAAGDPSTIGTHDTGGGKDQRELLNAATSNGRGHSSAEKEEKKSLEFMGSSTHVEIGHVFSGGRNVLLWTCHGIEWAVGRPLRRGLGSTLEMLMGTSAKCFKIKCVLVSCLGGSVPVGNGQCLECKGLVSKRTSLVPEKEEPSKRRAEERECS